MRAPGGGGQLHAKPPPAPEEALPRFQEKLRPPREAPRNVQDGLRSAKLARMPMTTAPKGQGGPQQESSEIARQDIPIQEGKRLGRGSGEG